MPGMWDRAGGRVLDGTLTDAARMGKGTTAGGNPASTCGVQGVLSADGGVGDITG